MDDALKVFRQYERGKEYLQQFEYYTKAEEAYIYYNGDQWKSLKVDGEKQPVLNILAPIVDFKVATVSQNTMVINYTTMNYDDMYQICAQVCEKLTAHAAKQWEILKLDKLVWKYVTEAAVTGDSFVYFYENDGQIAIQGIDSTNIFMSDEQEPNIQDQKYIIISQRLFVSDVCEEAKRNGVAEEDIALILPDDETSDQIGEKAKQEIEQDDEDGKCICLLKMWKEDGYVHFLRCTKNVVYQEDTIIKGLTLYPIAHFVWSEEKGSARGVGEVYFRIPNQQQINKTLARNLASIKATAYPHKVYNKDKLTIDAVKRLNTVGSSIAVGDKIPTDDIRKIITYLEPAQMSPAALNIVEELITQTRELASAGEAVTGNINPEQASGAAIIAVRDASALPLNNQAATFKQFIEDIALIWWDMWVAYNPNGLEVVNETKDEATGQIIKGVEVIDAEMLQILKIEVRIDVSPANPYSKFAREQALQNLLQMQLISFEDYVEALDDDSAAPKDKLKEIVEKQKVRMEQAAQAQQAAAAAQQNDYGAKLGQAAEMIKKLMAENAELMKGKEE